MDGNLWAASHLRAGTGPACGRRPAGCWARSPRPATPFVPLRVMTPTRPGASGWPRGYSSVSAAAVILRTLSGSAITSISAILPSATVKPITVTSRPCTVTTTPAAPFTSAGRRWAAARPGEHECPPGYGGCAADRQGGCGALGAGVGSQHDAGIEHGDGGVE